MSASAQLTVADRAKAAWLWSGRRGVVMGSTAAALHGARWVDQARPVELVSANVRPPNGVQTRKLSLRPDELMALRGLPVTTPARTAFDIGRQKPTGPTVAAMDALLRATGIRPEEVSMIAARHPGARGFVKWSPCSTSSIPARSHHAKPGFGSCLSAMDFHGPRLKYRFLSMTERPTTWTWVGNRS